MKSCCGSLLEFNGLLMSFILKTLQVILGFHDQDGMKIVLTG